MCLYDIEKKIHVFKKHCGNKEKMLVTSICSFSQFSPVECISRAECDTILSANTLYRHLEKYHTRPSIFRQCSLSNVKSFSNNLGLELSITFF